MRGAVRSFLLGRLAGAAPALRPRRMLLGVASLVLVIVAGLALAAMGTPGGKPGKAPEFDAPRGEHCIRDVQTMRRDHMSLLQQQRDDTVLRGKRDAQRGLRGCIECHAGAASGSVLGERGFCESCHRYAAVSIDCFECHSPHLAAKTAEASR